MTSSRDNAIVVIDDESEDETEIWEYDMPCAIQKPSFDDPNSRTTSHTEQSSHNHPNQPLETEKSALASSPASVPRYIPQVSNSTSDPSMLLEASVSPSPPWKTLSRLGTLSPQVSLRMSLSGTPEHSATSSRLGSSTHPVELEESTSVDHVERKHSKLFLEKQHSNTGSSSGALDVPLSFGGYKCGTIPESRVLIDLDELENFDDLWNDEEELQILRVEQRKVSLPLPVTPLTSKIAADQRNPPILAPFKTIPIWEYKGLIIRPSKTVELIEGDLLTITHIIQQPETGQVTLRGQRLQRSRSMNGLLEKKLNEVCFFQEVDLDDPRAPSEQSAIEVSLDQVQGLRCLRKTNQIFPLARNLVLEQHRTQLDAALEGGLTARWRYTCTYTTAADRWNNNHKERTLEFIEEDDCMRDYGISNAVKRFDWRGETVPGGACRPDLDDGRYSVENGRRGSITSLESINPDSDSDYVVIDSFMAQPKSVRSINGGASSSLCNLLSPPRKRRASSSCVILPRNDSWKSPKRMRYDNDDEVEIKSTRTELSALSVKEPEVAAAQRLDVMDLTGEFPSSQSQRKSFVKFSSPDQSQHFAMPSIPPTIDLSASNLATPPLIGTVPSDFAVIRAPIMKSPGQMLTYGDAFCGAGGATRGAAMAGLKVLWGFDHWLHACSTWRINFPQAKCYELSSQQFVSRAQGSKNRKPVDMKVDILHLSPPCQYFSPAHTVDCPADEMNVASLYAVGPVIKFARPRVVTLEQTFGIVAVRFRKYFNSLVHMFTALSFSVRWAVVPLAQWGLPQRRYRLIVIAACPGEILPRIPSPTHADPTLPSFESRNLPPFRTVNATLSPLRSIPPSPDHDPSSLLYPPHRRQRSWDGNAILPRAMTTHGGQNYHPSGERDFTLREYAALQGFPPNHVFVGSYIKKQIGNAVPPVVAKVLFESIKRELDAADGVVGEERMVID